MSSPVLHLTSRPLPPLPMELKKAVLSFCDPPTLARTSRVSLAFLEMSSPYLYRDVVVTWESLPALFSKRSSDSHQTIEPWLSLNLIDTLQVRKTALNEELPANFYPGRSSRERPLQVQCLDLDPVLSDDGHRAVAPFKALFDLVDPVKFRASGPMPLRSMHLHDLQVAWTRLNVMAFRNGGVDVFRIDDYLESYKHHLLRLHYRLSQDLGGNAGSVDVRQIEDGSQSGFEPQLAYRHQKLSIWFTCISSDLPAERETLEQVDITFENEVDMKAGHDSLEEFIAIFGDRMTLRVASSPSTLGDNR